MTYNVLKALVVVVLAVLGACVLVSTVIFFAIQEDDRRALVAIVLAILGACVLLSIVIFFAIQEDDRRAAAATTRQRIY